MASKKKRERKNLNSLIPMVDPDGNRSFVNAWDVAERQADGWEVLGDLRRHTSTVLAPVGELSGDGDEKPPAGAKAGKGKGGKKGAASGGAGEGDGDPADTVTPPA